MLVKQYLAKADSLLAATLVAGLLVLATPAAFAGSFTDIGVVYTLSSVFVSGTSTTQTFNVTLTVNDTGYSGPHPGSDLLDAVAIKVDNDNNILSESLVSGPSNWTFVDGGTNASGAGCTPSGNGFDCSQGGSVSYDLGTGPQHGGTYSWVFQVTVKSGTLLTTGASVKAQYVNSTATKQVAMTSQTTTNETTVPEPASMALLGTAVLGACALLRQKLCPDR